MWSLRSAYLCITGFLENMHATVFPSTSSDDRTDYYNFDDRKLKPATAISVDDLPDVVLQAEFRQELDTQFEVNKMNNVIFCDDIHLQCNVEISF